MKKNYNSQALRCSSAKFQYPVLLALMLFLNVLLYAQSPCGGPTNGVIQSLSSDGATISWSTPSPAPWYGYEYYCTASAFAPSSGTTPTGSTTSNSVTLTALTSNLTYYLYVRSKCGTVNGNIYSQWGSPLSFRTLSPGTGCPDAPFGLYPTTPFTPLYTGSQEIINSDAFAGEYCKVNVLANREYIFSTSVATDYITITNLSLNTILAYGPTPLTWNSNGYNGEVRYYISSNSNCGTQQINRVRSIVGRLPASNCGSPVSIIASSIQANQINLSWTDSSPSVSGNYQYYYSTSSATPSINAAPNGGTSFTYTTITGLTANTNYYYWIRKQCDVNLSQWTFGGSFSTLPSNPSGCFVAIYGQWPAATFTPNCTGTPEVITPIGRAGEFSVVSILPNRTYTFSSSVATDYITIQDDITDFIYASGLTPLVWSSGANTTEIKYYFHTSSNCGFDITSRTRSISCTPTPSCSTPNLLSVNSVTTSSATLAWNAANPAPSNGYQIYYSTSNIPPITTTAPTQYSAAASIDVSGLNSNTTYYFWVRSNCGSLQSSWVGGFTFTTTAVAVCTAPSNVTTSNISSNAAQINWSALSITPSYGYQYYYSTLNTAPINATTPSGSTLSNNTNISGLTASTTYYVWVRSSCEASNSAWISGGNFTTLAASCTPPSSPSSSNIGDNSADLYWLAAVPSPAQYDVYFATSSTAPTASTTPVGSIAQTSASLINLTANTTYYFWVRSNCGTTKSAWVSGGSFTTTIQGECTDAVYGLYPSTTFTPACLGTAETIVTDAYAGEYALVNILAGKQYTFASSVATDHITITNEAATVVYTSGTSPLVWLSGTNLGVIRYYFHTNSSCGNEQLERTRLITCNSATTTCSPPTNLIVDQIAPLTVRLNWTPSFLPIQDFDYLVRANNVTPTAVSTPSGTQSNTSVLVVPPNAQPNSTYYWWVRSNCGSTKSSWAVGGSFTTSSVTSCNQATFGLYPDTTFVPNCNNTDQLIDDFNGASQYANVAIQSNKQYTFTSSISTDFITIANAANTAVLASGTTPLVWTSGSNSGTVRFFAHKNAACATDNNFRSKFVKCSTALGLSDQEIVDLKLYPNPTFSVLNITNTKNIDKVEITNLLGQNVNQFHINGTHATIDLSNYPSEIYLVKVFVGNSHQLFKVIKK